MNPQYFKLNGMDPNMVGGMPNGMRSPSSHSMGHRGGASLSLVNAPGSPLLEAYHGTYQSISPMPSPPLIANSSHTGINMIEPLPAAGQMVMPRQLQQQAGGVENWQNGPSGQMMLLGSTTSTSALSSSNQFSRQQQGSRSRSRVRDIAGGPVGAGAAAIGINEYRKRKEKEEAELRERDRFTSKGDDLSLAPSPFKNGGGLRIEPGLCSTISRDNVMGEEVRHAELLALYGKKQFSLGFRCPQGGQPGQPTAQQQQQMMQQQAALQPRPQLKISPKLMNHVSHFPYVLPPQLTSGTPEAAKWLQDAKSRYLKALGAMETSAGRVQAMDNHIQKRKDERNPLSPEEEKDFKEMKEAWQKQHAEAKGFVDSFRQQQQSQRAAANARNQQGNSAQQGGGNVSNTG
jgi:hypothetical protein